MHTSTVLRSSDFRYLHRAGEQFVSTDFATLFPDYHVQDRAGVISRYLEDGLLHTGGALLALTTAFYDALRARGTAFFNYPQHFAILGGDGVEIQTRTGRLPRDAEVIGSAWGNLDVWPDSNWLTAPATGIGMLKAVFDHQINRLFWPEDLRPDASDALLPPHVRAILRSRLKSVFYYDSTSPTIEIHGSPPVQNLVRKS